MTEQQYMDFLPTLDHERDIRLHAIGLCEEAGEVAGKIKRIFRDDHGEITKERRAQILLECGDVLWYLTRIVDALGSTMKDVRAQNLKKLKDRAARNILTGSGDTR